MSATPTLTIGLLGAGRIGQVHAENLTKRISGVTLAAVADIDRSSAQSLAQRLGVATVCEDPQQVIDDPAIDAVLICTSTNTHSSLIEAAAAAGKHIFCEKPIDLELERIDSALAAVEAAGVKLQVGFNRRFDPNFSEVRERVVAGAIGEPHVLRITSRDPEPPPLSYVKGSGGLFQDMMIHDFDMARFLIGKEIVSVYAMGAAMVSPEIAEFGHIDTAVVTLEFEDGTLGTIDGSRCAVYGYDQRVEVFGSQGVVWADNNTPSRTGIGDKDGMHTPRPLRFFMDRYTESYMRELSAFIDCVRDDGPPSVSGNDGRMASIIAAAAQKSLTDRRPVTVTA